MGLRDLIQNCPAPEGDKDGTSLNRPTRKAEDPTVRLDKHHI